MIELILASSVGFLAAKLTQKPTATTGRTAVPTPPIDVWAKTCPTDPDMPLEYKHATHTAWVQETDYQKLVALAHQIRAFYPIAANSLMVRAMDRQAAVIAAKVKNPDEMRRAAVAVGGGPLKDEAVMKNGAPFRLQKEEEPKGVETHP